MGQYTHNSLGLKTLSFSFLFLSTKIWIKGPQIGSDMPSALGLVDDFLNLQISDCTYTYFSIVFGMDIFFGCQSEGPSSFDIFEYQPLQRCILSKNWPSISAGTNHKSHAKIWYFGNGKTFIIFIINNYQIPLNHKSLNHKHCRLCYCLFCRFCCRCRWSCCCRWPRHCRCRCQCWSITRCRSKCVDYNLFVTVSEWFPIL